MFFGYPVIGVEACYDWVQARTHKKKRINKKWRKRYGFRKKPWNKLFIADGKVYGHPKTIERYIKRMERRDGK